ncbi:hypothetical protein pEaSNUABM50_00020 [Erwinia phage pEa_SNUABM_50]|uniref:Uncharacterized protein n=4 Tax=Eneladusvirus BF TaxID=2560751 RepID=A0A7L8ZM02_9CAUD|nr:hypothetical protein FDH34_gp021 [Serratia phage BF]QOI70959.1 hypothetical protein pEaSNUABM12_00021 [Erwinia phage pEa_SNUABM_12]QOI71504.1 hypothetical protein pEaSNUABM47_00020 [Erwinia phage pEa_SNUABM_47]QOI72044.1 hypothetical protein pEaSNUABM50_00020 [Erwinia phage pEa_SNUABM_50]QXO11167.1 hypothetical protein pEaSNUABM19_00021 [Erwinia phage pEa_SNUABM_19]QXO11715.1 hypothetical protein pEaSNUABM44_00019 [Erwinia phage pEa_SNUABM_44]QXO12266.1 hypothetical protein pEaSNUABM49_000
MRVEPISRIIKLASSTVKNEYPKNIVDSTSSTVVHLGQATTGCYDKRGLIK